MGRQFNTDCEGPISKNDNAMELSEFYIPAGRQFFAVVSRYDDYLADIERRQGYKAGDTLKLILPFLKAFGATDEGMRDFSRDHILLVPGAKEALVEIHRRMEAFIISTSYESYIHALCEAIDFPIERTYATKVSLDQYPLEEREKERLIRLAREIAEMEMMDWPSGAKGWGDLSRKDQETIARLDQIFWTEILEMAIGKVLLEVNPVGGREKAKAVLHSLERTGSRLTDVLYVGDSITDVEAFELVRRGGGVTISFNGNRYALRAAELACLSPNASILKELAKAFCDGGREGVMEMVDRWRSIPEGAARIYRILDENRETLIRESEALRKQVRGVAIGSLG